MLCYVSWYLLSRRYQSWDHGFQVQTRIYASSKKCRINLLRKPDTLFGYPQIPDLEVSIPDRVPKSVDPGFRTSRDPRIRGFEGSDSGRSGIWKVQIEVSKWLWSLVISFLLLFARRRIHYVTYATCNNPARALGGIMECVMVTNALRDIRSITWYYGVWEDPRPWFQTSENICESILTPCFAEVTHLHTLCI